MFKTGILFCALLFTIAPLQAQKTQFTARFFGGWTGFPNPVPNPMRDQNGDALSPGTDAADDGVIFQVGYFADGRTEWDQARWDSFTPLTSLDGDSGHLLTTIGDEGFMSEANGLIGIFDVAVTLDRAVPEQDSRLPADPSFPVKLGIRFYNATTIEDSTHFNTVSSDDAAWFLTTPATIPALPAALTMDSSPLVWESGSGGQFQTVLAIAPEPSTALLLMLGALFGMRRRR